MSREYQTDNVQLAETAMTGPKMAWQLSGCH